MNGLAAHLRDTRQAFDSVAAVYDGPSGNNALVQRMRRQLWQTVQQTFPPGSRLLDLGCGTGLDAIHLAHCGYRVLAIDASPQMVARTRARAVEEGVQQAVTAAVLDMHELDHLTGEAFDGIYSNLGALNCALALPAVAQSCAALLQPQGRLIASVIGRWCPWELAYYAARGQLGRAMLRLSPEARPVGLNGHTVWTHYLTPQALYAAFASDFALTHYRALGLLVPPPYLIGVQQRFPTLVARLARLDDRLGALPLARNLGDHFLMVLTRHG